MKTANIALFKQFLKENGVNQLFCGLYRQFRFPESPESVEEYMEKVDSRDAILNAFKFPTDIKTFGPEYWLELAVKWENRLEAASRDGGQYSAAAIKRIERHASKPLDVWTGPAFKEKGSTQPAKEVPKELVMPRERIVVSEEEMALSGFRFFDINKSPQQRLLDGFVSINSRNGYRMNFNSTVSEEIVASGLKRFRIGQKGSEKALFVVFSNDADGMPWRTNAKNVCFSNKELIVRIFDFFGIKEDYSQLAISKNMANKKDYLTYKLTERE